MYGQLSRIMRFTMLCGDCTPATRTDAVVSLFSVYETHRDTLAQIRSNAAALRDMNNSRAADAAFRATVASLLPGSAAALEACDAWGREHGSAMHSILYDMGATVEELRKCVALALSTQQIASLVHMWHTNLKHTDVANCRNVTVVNEAVGFVSNAYNLMNMMHSLAALSVTELLHFSNVTEEDLERVLAIPAASEIVDGEALRRCLQARAVVERVRGSSSATRDGPAAVDDLLGQLRGLRHWLQSNRGPSDTDNPNQDSSQPQ
jgi:hypothetical protein